MKNDPATGLASQSSTPLPRWKRAAEVSCCLLALPLLGVVTLFVACVTTTAAQGPIFFRQQRLGLKGQRIWLYRFRTMRVGPASRSSGLIPGGVFLRATGLAELPQIVNVLRGEMSSVGPRPQPEDTTSPGDETAPRAAAKRRADPESLPLRPSRQPW